MNRSDSIDQIADSLAKAQAKIKGAVKDSKNEHFKNRYADLESVWDACRDALTSNGIGVVQSPETAEDGTVIVYTLLAHKSGQWFEGALACKPMKFDAQGVGSTITYLRRYALAGMCGVAPADDDGEAAVGRPGGSQPAARQVQVNRGAAQKPAPRPANDNGPAAGTMTAANDNSDWPVWIEGFKAEFSAQPDYASARDLWTSHGQVLDGLKEQQPAAYAALVTWAKGEGERLSAQAEA